MKLLNHNKSIAVLFTLLSFGVFSCEPEQTLTDQELVSLPKVANASSASSAYLTKIKSFNSFSNGRTNESLDFEGAITATYEGYDEMEFVYISNNSSDNTFQLYSFENGELRDNVMTIENNPNSIIISNEVGEMTVDFDENVVTDVEVDYFSSFNGRTNECGLAEGFMECGNAIQDQLVEEVGATAALILEIGCGLWVVCRGAVAIGCASYAILDCPQ